MQQNTNLTSPTVRVQKSSPTPTPAQASPMLAQSQHFMGGGWNDAFQNTAYLSALPRNFQQDPRYHKRASSGSSVASAGPPSPLDQQANIYHPRIATSDAHYSPSRYDFDFNSPQTAKTAHSAPDTMMFGANPNYGAVDMRRIQSQGHDDRASYAEAPSVSTMSHHNSPATPQTFEPDYSDDKTFGEQVNNLNTMFSGLQGAGNFHSMAYQQSLQDVFPEQQQQMYAMQKMNNHRQISMQDRLQAAQQDHLRTHSPTSNPRENSPFRNSSPFVRPTPQQRPQPVPQLQKQRTSISPKELMLDERDIEENQPSLFPEQSNYNQRRQRSSLSNFYTPSTFGPESSMQIPQHYPFVSQSSRADSMNILADSTPDFSAPMLSMESTNEEEPSSQQSVVSRQPPKSEPRNSSSRPADVSSDAGTYSCTYHGCPQRFDSPAKLQKHKREGHRQHEGHTSPTLVLRNSQAGPHRCDRINPSTGKPCNSVFSRPYDLTRHEDTIHNGRKQKVRCHLCTEEKTFSRNDALTRHMRVVHPDVDWVGKQKRKSHK